MTQTQDSVQWPFTPAARNIEIVGAGGAYLIQADGSRLLDAAGGAIVVNVGHGRESVAQAVYEATKTTTYVVPPWLTTERRNLIERLRADWLPPSFDHIHLTCGGSEGVETAMKIAIQSQAARGEPTRTKIIGRSVSYHGTTLATTAVGGHTARKKGLAHVLETYPSVPTPYPLRCPLGAHHPGAGRCPDEGKLRQLEPQTPRLRSLVDDDIEPIIFHRRVKIFLDRRLEPVDFIYEQDVAFLQARQQTRQLAGLLDHGSARVLDVRPHRVRDDVGERRLPKPGRPAQQNMFENVSAFLGRFDEQLQPFANFHLSGELAEHRRPERNLEGRIRRGWNDGSHGLRRNSRQGESE